MAIYESNSDGKTIRLPEWTELLEKAKDWEYGSIHTHDEIADIVDLPKNSHKYYSCITGANKRLLEIGKVLKSVHKEGYQVLNPDEYTDEAIKHYDSGKRRIKKGYKTLQYAPKENMTDDGKKRFRTIIDKAMAINAAISGGITEVKLLIKPKLLIRHGND